MSIAEKLIKVAENVPKVYEAGQKSMVDESKIIEKTVSGSVISLDDVSEIPHEVNVQLSSDTVTDFSGVAVNVIGENLFDAKKYPLIVGREIWAHTGNVTYGNTEVCGTEVYVPCSSLRGKTITILHTTVIGVLKGVAFYDDDKTYISGVQNNNGIKLTATIPDNATYYRFCMDVAYIDVAQIYETNNEKTYTANADGTLTIKSASPNMYITAETDGINITSTYHKSWGMQTEYDRFWDAYQQEGAVLYSANYMFASPLWVDGIYKPKYPIIPQRATAMYRYTGITDVIVDLDFTQSVAPGSTSSVFANTSALKRIPKIKVLENMKYDSWFTSNTSLEEIRFEGIIGNSLDIHWSTKLSMESLASIVNALSKTASGQSITLPTTARQTYDNATISGAWDNLVSQYTNWTFAYA